MSELNVSDLLTVDQAIAIIDAAIVQPRIIQKPLLESLGHHLAVDVKSDRDYPPFDKSLMDGFAVRDVDLRELPATLRVVGEIAAGSDTQIVVAEREAAAIMTGAPIPAGADCVIPVEDTHVQVDEVSIKTAPGSRFISRRGSDIRCGQVILKRGIRLAAPQIATLASVGAVEVDVFDRPRVAVLSTGDEVVPVEQSPGEAQIRNSNGPMLASLLKQLNCDVVSVCHERDDPHLLREAIARNKNIDALFITGGMSMGKYDYIPQLLKDLGYELKITKLRIKPGKPFVFAVSALSTQHPALPFVFGLPGNPVSAFVCTIRLAARLLTRIAGGEPSSPILQLQLGEAVAANGPREFYQPAQLRDGLVYPLKWKGSGDVFTLANADALLIRKENEPALEKRTPVQVIVL